MESLSHLHSDARWWLSAQLPPNNTSLVVLISFRTSEHAFRLEQYESVAAGGPITKSPSLGARNIGKCKAVAIFGIRSTAQIITGAPFVLSFAKVMRLTPAAAERDISPDDWEMIELHAAFLDTASVGRTSIPHSITYQQTKETHENLWDYSVETGSIIALSQPKLFSFKFGNTNAASL